MATFGVFVLRAGLLFSGSIIECRKRHKEESEDPVPKILPLLPVLEKRSKRNCTVCAFYILSCVCYVIYTKILSDRRLMETPYFEAFF